MYLIHGEAAARPRELILDPLDPLALIESAPRLALVRRVGLRVADEASVDYLRETIGSVRGLYALDNHPSIAVLGVAVE